MKNRIITTTLMLIVFAFNAFAMGNAPETPDTSAKFATQTITEEAREKTYDGIWFIGFNLKKKIFNDEDGRIIRQAFSMAINRKIISKIIGDEIIPAGIIPPKMEGYDPTLKGYPYDLRLAKRMMRSTGYSLYDKRLKNLTILHTDGKKTLRIVNRIKMDLVDLGVSMKRIQVSSKNPAKWKNMLKSGKYDMFVMGYKAGDIGELFIGDKDRNIFHTFACHLNPTDEARQRIFNTFKEAVNAGFSPDIVCQPKHEDTPDTIALLKPLFYSKGDVNFTFYKNRRVDYLLKKLEKIDKKKKLSRYETFNEIDRIIWDDCPVLGLFYITKL